MAKRGKTPRRRGSDASAFLPPVRCELEQHAVTTTCREAVLDAFARLEGRHHRTDFTLAEIVAEVRSETKAFAESTVRTHVTSRLCSNAPDNHEVVHDDLERVERGLYRRRQVSR